MDPPPDQVPACQVMEELGQVCAPDQVGSRPGITSSTCYPQVDKLVCCLPDPYSATHSAHAVVVCTEWDQFLTLDWQRIYSSMAKPAFVFDGRKILDHDQLVRMGFVVETIGKRVARPEGAGGGE